MQKVQHLFNRFVSILLILLLLFACVEIGGLNTVYAGGISVGDSNSEDTLHEEEAGSEKDDQVNSGDSDSSSQTDNIYGNPDLDGLIFNEITTGSTDITKSGIYTTQEGDYTYLYITAKKASSGKRYRTIGFTIHADKMNGSGLEALQNKIEIRINYGDDSDNINLQTKIYSSNPAIQKLINDGLTINFEKRGSGSNQYYEDDDYGNFIGTCYRIETDYLAGIIRNTRIGFDDTSEIYMSGIQAINNGSEWNPNSFRDKAPLQEIMASLGFSETSRNVDVPLLFDIPLNLPLPSYTVSTIDISTGERLSYEKLKVEDVASFSTSIDKDPKNSFEQVKSTHVSHYNMGIQADKGIVTINGKQYYLKGIALMPSTLLDNGTDSKYLANVKDNIKSKRMEFPASFQLTNDLESRFKKGGYDFYSVSDNTGVFNHYVEGTFSYSFNKGVTIFDDLQKLNVVNMIYYNPLFGCNGYWLLEPVGEMKGLNGELLYVNGSTGKYFNLKGKILNYEDAKNKFLNNLDSSTRNRMVEHTKGMSPYEANKVSTFTDTVETTIVDADGRVYRLEKIEYVNDFNPDGLGIPQQGWDTYVKETEMKSVENVMQGKDAYIGTEISSRSEFDWLSQIVWGLSDDYDEDHTPSWKHKYQYEFRHPSNGDETTLPLYRAVYQRLEEIPVVYYDEKTAQPIKLESTSASIKTVVATKVKLGDKVFNTKELSYKVGISRQDDIDSTRLPIMTDTDQGRTPRYVINIPEDIVEGANYIIRVACTTDPVKLESTGDLGTHVIPSQYLSKPFHVDIPLAQHVEEPNDVERTHTYTTTSANGKTSRHTCNYIDPDFDMKTNYFDWDSTLERMINPKNYLFADLYGLTKVNDMKYTSESADITGEMNLDWTSHRVDVDGVAPVFASFMNQQNTKSLAYLKDHSMSDLANEGLVPNDQYNNKGGDEPVSVAVQEGSKYAEHGWYYKKYTRGHGGCGSENGYINDGYQRSADFTNGIYEGNVKAEPSTVATALPVAEDFNTVKGTQVDQSMTYIATNKAGGVNFFPTYKMFVGDNSDAWVLGKEKRTLNAMNVAEIKVLNTTPVVDVESTWSRDKVDTGKLVAKGGYVLNTKSNQPMKIQVTTYTVVPKEGWVDDFANVRKTLLDNHNSIISELKTKTNYNVMTNLPESFNENVNDEWKRTNQYKKSGDAWQKSRVPDLNGLSVTSNNTQSSIISLEDLDSLYPDTINNVQRLKDQLEKNGWYEEKFDGFEVIKQVTTISATFTDTKFVNFIRNGGTNYNDVAVAVRNIPAKVFGIEMGCYKKEVDFFGNKIEVERLTAPFKFNVRGAVYDDRV